MRTLTPACLFLLCLATGGSAGCAASPADDFAALAAPLASDTPALQVSAQQPEPPTGPPEITLPSTVKGKPGAFIKITADTEGPLVNWKALDDGLSIFPRDLLKDTHSIVVVGSVPGKYRVAAWTADAKGEPSDLAICVVEIEGAVPPPPPGPTPPVPPGPMDPLTMKLQAAYSADPAPAAQKASYRAALLGLYQALPAHALDTRLRTCKDLHDDMKKVSDQMLPATALVACRTVIAGEMAGVMGTDPAAPLDPVLRGKAAEFFGRVAGALAQVK